MWMISKDLVLSGGLPVIEFTSGNMFDEPFDIRINTVNCVGVMGKGLALKFKNRYPEMFEEYKIKCFNKEIRPGKLYIWACPNGEEIINFPTKNHWKRPSEERFIIDGLVDLKKYLKIKPSETTIAIPALGCGYGGLEWHAVKSLISLLLSETNVNIKVFPPQDSK